MKLMAESGGKSSELWKHLNILTNRVPKQQKLIAELNIDGIVSNERTEIANHFNRFYIQSAEELADNFQPVQLKHILRDQTTSFCIKEVDQRETAEVFRQLRQSKAKDNFGLVQLL